MGRALLFYARDVELATEPEAREVVAFVVKLRNADPEPARDVAREFLTDPRYTLLQERAFGERIVAQRWALP